jgi:two-component system chemotaxis response regulator CheB
VKRSTGRFDERGEPAPVAYAIVVVGTSWGGLTAIRAIMAKLPADYDLPTVVVQHRHKDSNAMLARLLQDHTPLHVCEPDDKQPIEAGRLYVAPANYHMFVEAGHFSLSLDAPVRYSRPSIDVTLMSAASAYKHRAVGAILTGANADGAEGLRRIADMGGLAVVQDPTTAEAATMPAAALRAVPTARVFPIDRLGSYLGALPSAYRTAKNS